MLDPQAPKMIVTQYLEKHFNTKVSVADKPSERELDILQYKVRRNG